ncbi:MAG: hypothetical protein ABJN34_09750 [Litoreibacter sp.]|uniref:hypothetical protein n=1 Tax=Litoreibacter sp. TaxID=1969459 RepID=UPI0032968095
MALKVEHELHQRRFGRNIGVGLLLVGFVAIVFGLTVVKVKNTGFVEGYDHVARPALIDQEGGN